MKTFKDEDGRLPEPKAPVDSKGAAIDEALDNYGAAYATYVDVPKEQKYLRKAKKEATKAILAILAQEVKKARRQAIEEFTDDWLGQALAKSDLPNGWVYRTKDKYLRKAGLE